MKYFNLNQKLDQFMRKVNFSRKQFELWSFEVDQFTLLFESACENLSFSSKLIEL